jgi:hypothetical protein
MELEKSWASVMHQDHTDFAKRRNDRLNCSVSQQRRQRFRPMWHVREHMAFLIRNLQFYIQVLMPSAGQLFLEIVSKRQCNIGIAKFFNYKAVRAGD